MTTTLSQLLDEIRSTKRTERDVGDRLKEIVQVYFNHDAQMRQQYENAVSWAEWVRREEIDETRQDTGIDLVALSGFENIQFSTVTWNGRLSRGIETTGTYTTTDRTGN